MTSSIRGSILLADDEEKILKRLGRALRDEGHEVVETTSAKGAQRQLGEKSFDLLVVDNVMPGMTGLELAAHLADQDASLPVILMSAHAFDPPAGSRWTFVQKPFDPADLLEHVRRALHGTVAAAPSA